MDGNQNSGEDFFQVAGRRFQSRLLVGTGKYKDFTETALAIEASGAEIVTVAVRRVNVSDPKQPMLMDFVDPKKYKSAEAGIDPMRYFITSGDAVQKIGIMIQHVRTAIRKNKNAYGKALQKMLKEATTLQKVFLEIRGPHCFLETEWDSHRLVCVPKDPRKRDDESQTASN